MFRITATSRLLAALLFLSLTGGEDVLAKSSHALRLARALKVHDQVLAPDDYTVSWTVEGKEASVTITLKRAVVATVSAMLVTRERKYDRDMIVHAQRGSGPPTILELRFAGSREVLILN